MNCPKPPAVVCLQLAVVSPDTGEHLFWATEDEARVLIRKKQVRFFRKNGVVRMLMANDNLMAQYGKLTGGRGTAMDKTRYSHDHETETNPKNCWTLKHLPRSTSRIFLSVAQDCGAVIRKL
ncbi:MAG: hypothetical protein NVS1B14_03730 [Vulcanimicrobiaceae bacterium]